MPSLTQREQLGFVSSHLSCALLAQSGGSTAQLTRLDLQTAHPLRDLVMVFGIVAMAHHSLGYLFLEMEDNMGTGNCGLRPGDAGTTGGSSVIYFI